MQYRREIDGLRAVAVLPVILFHAGFSVFSGGYVGVDVFFVISGYLITSILVSELEQDNFSILRFYERRARRILPALFFVMLACLPFAYMWMLPTQLKDFAQSLVAVVFFGSNILFWHESGYFDSAAELKPLLHTWSLAVEEQYYLIFPLFLLLVWRFGRNRAFWSVVAIAAFSLLFAEWGWRNSPSANFYLAPTRAWELLAGSICAFLTVGRTLKSNNVLSAIGLAAIVFSIFGFDENTPFPSVFALVPVVGTALIILFGRKGTWVAKLLSMRTFVGIGLISYSAYLWHQPLFAFARLRSLTEPSDVLMAVLAVVALLLAWATWRWVEQPFRKRKNSLLATRRSVFVASGTVGAVFVAIGLGGHVGKGFEWRFDNPLDYQPENIVLQTASWNILREISRDESYGVANNAFDNTLWFDQSDERYNVLLVGNSHAKDLFNVLFFSSTANTYLQIARYGSQIEDLDENFFNSPNYLNADALILVSRYREGEVNALEELSSRIVSDGKIVGLVPNIFEFHEDNGATIADIFVRNCLRDSGCVADGTGNLVNVINQALFDDFEVNVNESIYRSSLSIMDELAKDSSEIVILDRMDYVCEIEDQICFSIDTRLNKFFYDFGHHTLEGAQFFASEVDNMNWLSPIIQALQVE